MIKEINLLVEWNVNKGTNQILTKQMLLPIQQLLLIIQKVKMRKKKIHKDKFNQRNKKI